MTIAGSAENVIRPLRPLFSPSGSSLEMERRGYVALAAGTAGATGAWFTGSDFGGGIATAVPFSVVGAALVRGRRLPQPEARQALLGFHASDKRYSLDETKKWAEATVAGQLRSPEGWYALVPGQEHAYGRFVSVNAKGPWPLLDRRPKAGFQKLEPPDYAATHDRFARRPLPTREQDISATPAHYDWGHRSEYGSLHLEKTGRRDPLGQLEHDLVLNPREFGSY